MSNHRVEVGPFAFNVKEVLLPMGLTVANVDIQAFGATIDSSPFALVLDQPGTLTAEVTEADLTKFLETQEIAGLHSFDIRAEGGKLHVKAKKTVLVDLKVTAVASLRIVNDKELWIDVESVDVMGAGAKNIVQSQIAKINPILNADDLPVVAATLESVEIEDGKITLRGTVAPRETS